MAPPEPPDRPRRRPPARRPAPPTPGLDPGRAPPPSEEQEEPRFDAADDDEDSEPLSNRFRPVAYGALALTVGVVAVSLAFGVRADELPWLAIVGVLVLAGVMLRADRGRSRS